LDGGLAAERTNEIVRAMMEVDPTMEAVIGLVSDAHLRPWSRAFMDKLDCPYAYVSYHWYYGTGPTAEPNGPLACEHMKQTYLHDEDEGLEFFKHDLLGSVWDTVKINVNEWNFCWGSGSNNALLISNALQLHFFARNSEKYHIREARFFMPINEGMITVTPTESLVESSGELFRLMGRHRGGTVVPCSVDSDEADVLCTLHNGGNAMYLSAVNRSASPMSFRVEGYESQTATVISIPEVDFNSNEYTVTERSTLEVSGHSVLFCTLNRV
jgi:hypothetical protein